MQGLGGSNKVDDGLLEAFVLEGSLGEVEVGAGLEASAAVLFAIFVGEDDDRQTGEAGVFADLDDEFDSVHLGHIHIADEQVVFIEAKKVPGLLAVLGGGDGVACADEDTALCLAHSVRVVNDQDVGRETDGMGGMEVGRGGAPMGGLDEVFNVQDQQGETVGVEGGGVDTRDLSETAIELSDGEFHLVDEPVDGEGEIAA